MSPPGGRQRSFQSFESFIDGAEPIAPDPASFGLPPATVTTAGDDVWDTESSSVGVYGVGFGFKPGTPSIYFCNDPGAYNFCAGSG